MSTGPLDALEKFKALEGRIGQVLETLKNARQEKKDVERELSEARRQIKLLQGEIDGLRKERALVRNRVENLIERIAEPREKQIV